MERHGDECRCSACKKEEYCAVCGQNKKRSAQQIKREWEEAIKNRDLKREQDIRAVGFDMVMKHGTATEKNYPFIRAGEITRWILHDKAPKR